jgi:hypothetical protein
MIIFLWRQPRRRRTWTGDGGSGEVDVVWDNGRWSAPLQVGQRSSAVQWVSFPSRSVPTPVWGYLAGVVGYFLLSPHGSEMMLVLVVCRNYFPPRILQKSWVWMVSCFGNVFWPWSCRCSYRLPQRFMVCDVCRLWGLPGTCVLDKQLNGKFG